MSACSWTRHSVLEVAEPVDVPVGAGLADGRRRGSRCAGRGGARACARGRSSRGRRRPRLVSPAKPPLRVTSTTRPAPAAPASARGRRRRPVDPDRVPASCDTAAACSPAAATRGRGEGGEVAVRGQAGGEGGVPDPAGAAPGVAADRAGRQHERPVGDAAVDVHPAVVVGRVDVVRHRSRPAGPCRAAGRRTPCRGPSSSAAPCR